MTGKDGWQFRIEDCGFGDADPRPPTSAALSALSDLCVESPRPKIVAELLGAVCYIAPSAVAHVL